MQSTTGWAAAAALGLGLALLVAGGDLEALGAGLLGYDNTDAEMALGLHHAFCQALSEGRSPAVDPAQLVPVGAPLAALHGGNGLEMLASCGLRAAGAGPLLAINLAGLAFIPLNLLAFVPLGRHLWGRWGPALAAGAAFAVWPTLLGELAAGRQTQMALMGAPLAVLGLLRVAERGAPQDRWLLAGGLALLGAGYWFYAIFLAILAPLFLLVARRPGAALRDMALAGLIALGLVAPLLWPALAPRLLGDWAPSPPLDPATASPLFDNALRWSGEPARQLRGWFPWALLPGLLVTAAAGRRRALWFGGALLCVLFAFGPATELFGRGWRLPYELLWRGVPGLDRLTHPGRWLGLGALLLVVAASDGLARRRPALLWALPAGALAQQLVLGGLPLGSWTPELPPVWAAAAQGQGAVIVVPVLGAPRTFRWTPEVGRPLLGGMVEDKPWAWPPAFRAFVEGSPLLMGLYALGQGQAAPDALYQADLDALQAAGFRDVLWDREAWGPRPIDPRPALVQLFGEARFDDPSGALWSLPAAGLPGALPAPARRLPEP